MVVISEINARSAAARQGIRAADAFLFLFDLLGDYDSPGWLKDWIKAREKRRRG